MSNDIIPAGGGAVVPASTNLAPGEVRSMPGPSAIAARNASAPAKSKAPAVATSLPINMEEGDRDIALDFTGAMRADGLDEPTISKALKWYQGWAARIAESEKLMDAEDVTATIATLKKDWGPNYAANVATAKAHLKTLPLAVQQALPNAALSDGSLLLNTAAGAKWLLSLASGGTAITPDAQSVDAEIAEIERVMRKERPRYNRDPKMQARYRELLQIRGK